MGHYLRYSIVAAAGLLGALCTGMALAAADPLPPISGMALIEGREFLIVVDTKADSDAVRCGVLSVGEDGGYSFMPLEVAWPGERANDLESASPIPGRPGEFLVAESGAWTDRATGTAHQGRIFHLRLARTEAAWTATVLGTLPLNPMLREVEGMACLGLRATPARDYDALLQQRSSPFPDSGSLGLAAPPPSAPEAPVEAPADKYALIALGTRGGSIPYEQAVIYWGYAELDAGTWAKGGLEQRQVGAQQSYYERPNPWLRGLTDIYADPNGVLWIARASDPGDGGSFVSYISQFGSLEGDQRYVQMGPMYDSASWVVYGLKVEALGAPVLPGSVISFATDDESYGGVWRPLGP